MNLLLNSLLILVVVGLCIWALQEFSPDAKLTRIGSVILILIGVFVIARQAGVL